MRLCIFAFYVTEKTPAEDESMPLLEMSREGLEKTLDSVWPCLHRIVNRPYSRVPAVGESIAVDDPPALYVERITDVNWLHDGMPRLWVTREPDMPVSEQDLRGWGFHREGEQVATCAQCQHAESLEL